MEACLRAVPDFVSRHESNHNAELHTHPPILR
jgi:hypothetical protein